MVIICKVKIFSHKEKHKGIFHHPCNKTKELSKLGPIFMCSFGTDDTEAHVEVRNYILKWFYLTKST
jgi:hypothetical protein